MSGIDATTIRPAELDDHQAIATLLSEAFLHADLAPWLIADEDDRARIYPRYFALLAEQALANGHVEMTCDGAGVAVWYIHDGTPIPPLPDYGAQLADITKPYAARFAALDDTMHRHHPTDEPHHYLALLAVHPADHGGGYGSRLLDHHHAQLDATGTAAYLEATGYRTDALYRRHGYQRRQPYLITRDSPVLLPMWRPSSPKAGERS
ncbi:GNAT family N-acetyltransferase [Actinoplanes sp. NPDC051859]|uniref:GNAT family N-acetyltransferase n=1 Tax=Actinoplanes sp. NPDC051859 TaxID=3363909 RepID=UPI0037B2297B